MLQSKKKLILTIAKNSVLAVSPRTPTFFQPKVEWEVIYFADYNSNGKVVSVWSKAWWQDGNFCTSKSSITTAGSFIIHHHSKGKESRSESWKSESLIRSLTPHSAVYFHICRESDIGINYTLFPLKKTIPLGLSKIIQQEFPLQGVNSTTMNISGLMGKQTTDKVSRRALFFSLTLFSLILLCLFMLRESPLCDLGDYPAKMDFPLYPRNQDDFYVTVQF